MRKSRRVLLVFVVVWVALFACAQQDPNLSPLLIHAVNPKFPDKPRKKKNAQGEIRLKARVASDGAVQEVTPVSGDPKLAPAAEDAVRQWRYLPVLENGVPVEWETDVTIKYDLSKGASRPHEPLTSVPREPREDLLREILAGRIFRVGGAVTAPKAVYAPDPEYSEIARSDKFQGELSLGVVVGADGLPRDIWVIRPLGEGLDENAIQVVKQWKFSPASKDGKPVTCVISVNVTFSVW